MYRGLTTRETDRADVAQLEERHVANVKVAGSNPAICSKQGEGLMVTRGFWKAEIVGSTPTSLTRGEERFDSAWHLISVPLIGVKG